MLKVRIITYGTLALVLLATIFAYLPSLSGDFYHDDLQNLVLNKSVQIEELDIETLQNAAFSSYSGILRRPVSMTSFALNYYFFGSQPYSFKTVNLLLHLCTGILVYLFAYYMKVATTRITENKKNEIHWIPLCVAALWLLHPLHVSTTAYIVQRMTILAALFSLLSIVFYIAGRIRLQKNEKKGTLLILFSVICIVPAVLSKENGILIIPLIAFIEIYIFKFQALNKNLSNIIKSSFYIGCVGSIFLLFIFFDPIRSHIEAGYFYREFSFQERLLTQPRILLNYLQWIIAPNISTLGLYHDDIANSTSLVRPLTTLLSIFAIVVLFVLGFLSRKTYPLILFGLCWYFISHALESSVIALEMVYEHRNYLPSIGILLVIAELVRILTHKINNPRFTLSLAIVACGLLASTTYLRASQWTNVVDFSYYEALHHPNSPRSVYALGRIYGNLTLTGELKFQEKANQLLERAAELDQGGITPEAALLLYAHKMNSPANSQWLDSITYKLASFKLTPNDLIALSEITKCTESDCLLTNEEAYTVLLAAFKSPNADIKSNRRADLLTIYANFLTNRAGDFKTADTVMREAIEIAPHIPQYYINYINLLLVSQRLDEAASYISKLKQVDNLNAKSNIVEGLEAELEIISTKLTNNQNEY